MEKLKILVDADNPEVLKGALPLPNFDKITSNVIEISSDFIKDKLQTSVTSILNVLADIKVESQKAKIKEIKFTVGFTAGGEVGLFSIAKGTASGTTGIEFVIEF